MRYRFLLGAMRQIEIAQTVRAACVDAEIARLPDILAQWRTASQRMRDLVAVDPLQPVAPAEMPPEVAARIRAIEADPLFRASFSEVPSRCQLVDVDTLVAPQREVNLDYVDTLRGRLAGHDLASLIEFCLGPRATPPPINALQTAQNQMTFTSPSLDLRFLGGFPKPLTEADIQVAHFGGQPSRVIALLVGFGAAPINVRSAGTRIVLNNGFHRVVALRMEGIQRIPVVVQHAANPAFEFPDHVLGLSQAYLLTDPRPVLVKDFFDTHLVTELNLKPRVKSLRVAWGPEDSIVPTE
jgi:hypothetical protein